MRTGAKTKLNVFALVGITVSFSKSFKPSANGCNRPKKPTTLGPLRCCIAPMIFLSASVRYATEIKMGTTISKNEATLSIKNITWINGFEPLLLNLKFKILPLN